MYLEYEYKYLKILSHIRKGRVSFIEVFFLFVKHWFNNSGNLKFWIQRGVSRCALIWIRKTIVIIIVKSIYNKYLILNTNIFENAYLKYDTELFFVDIFKIRTRILKKYWNICLQIILFEYFTSRRVTSR